MKKILKKIGITILGIVVSLKSFTLKVYAQSTFDPMSACDYGIVQPQPNTHPVTPNIARIFSTIIIPIVLIVGLIVYFVKSKSEVWKKVLIIIGIIVVYITFAVIISNI